MTALNTFLDRLPRVRVGRGGRAGPAFRAAGVAGYYAAVIVTLGGGLRAGLSLLVLAVVSAACALSFFGWAWLRRWFTGRETLVLLEHVWIALACAAATLAALGQPVLAYLDVVGVGLGVFLSAGRVGCLLVGCCHGHPSSIGIVYGESIARDGFSRHLVGVRLFPVQAIESLGLLATSVAAFIMLPTTPPGGALAWFLAAYAVLRFGLEGLRGDARPHWLGLSVGRWMAVAELGSALVLAERRRGGGLGAVSAAELASLAILLAGALVVRHARDLAPKLLHPAHVRELRDLVRAAVNEASSQPTLRVSSRGVSVAVSRPRDGEGIEVSLCLPAGANDLPLLARVAARALPEIDAALVRLVGDGLLFARVREPTDAAPMPPARLADDVYGALVRQFQADRAARLPALPVIVSAKPAVTELPAPPPAVSPADPAPPPAVSPADPAPRPAVSPADPAPPPKDRRSYFTPSKAPTDRIGT
ncbi:prolipoprotein diacylglyceryl transferase family protein [Sorangium sp. So ce854]|uniref:prolipoprotein diacylglyceryl transferase family protein n=1 Tax=Sorangium sp. So ce854 TaxID=3133322 RepID=UPI003F5FECF2